MTIQLWWKGFLARKDFVEQKAEMAQLEMEMAVK